MSAGVFTNTKYAADYGDGDQIHPIRVQPETLSATVDGTDNEAPAGAITNPISAISSLSNRRLGLKPRKITIQFPATGQPTGYKPSAYTSIPALNREFFDAAQKGDDITYLGVTCKVVAKSQEEAK